MHSNVQLVHALDNSGQRTLRYNYNNTSAHVSSRLTIVYTNELEAVDAVDESEHELSSGSSDENWGDIDGDSTSDSDADDDDDDDDDDMEDEQEHVTAADD